MCDFQPTNWNWSGRAALSPRAAPWVRRRERPERPASPNAPTRSPAAYRRAELVPARYGHGRTPARDVFRILDSSGLQRTNGRIEIGPTLSCDYKEETLPVPLWPNPRHHF